MTTLRRSPALLLVAVALAGCMGGTTATAPAPAASSASLAPTSDAASPVGQVPAAGEAPAAAPERPVPTRAESRRDARAKGMGLVQADDVEAYANKVARQIVERNGLAKVDVAVVISADRTPGAYVERDGLVVVPVGLLMDFQNEDELAFLLAHEIAHVELGHHDRGWLQRHQEKAVRVVETATRVEDALGRSLRGFKGTEGGLDESYAKAQAYLTAADRVLFTYWSRKQEREADARGRALMKGAGYNPNAIEGVFEVMRRWEGIERQALVMLKEGLAVAGINDPETNGMIKELEDVFTGNVSEGRIAQQGATVSGGKGGSWLMKAAEFAKPGVDALGMKVGNAADAVTARLDIGHPSIDERKADMTRLNEADPFEGSFKATAYKKALSPAPTKAVLDSYRLAFEARQALDERQWPLAFEKAQAALRGPAADHAQQRLTIAAIRTARGDRKEARGDLGRATAVQEPALRPFVQLAADYEAEGDLGGVRAAINDAEASLGERPETMQARTRLLIREDNRNLAMVTAERCALKFPEARVGCMEPVGQGGGFRLPPFLR